MVELHVVLEDLAENVKKVVANVALSEVIALVLEVVIVVQLVADSAAKEVLHLAVDLAEAETVEARMPNPEWHRLRPDPRAKSRVVSAGRLIRESKLQRARRV